MNTSLREKIEQWAKANKVFLFSEPTLSSLEALIEAHTAEQTRELENIKLILNANIPGEYTDPLTGKKLYNEHSLAEAVREAKNGLPHIQEFYDWCTEEGIDEGTMYKIAGWMGSEIYLPSHLTQSTKEETPDE